jgi:hypothetical protein
MHDVNWMLDLLEATGPNPAHAKDLMLFGQLIGSWHIDMTSIDPKGGSRTFVGEWHFGWTLDGLAIQDVLITRTTEGEVVGYGSTVRSLDAKRGLWWVVWQDPLAGEFSVLLARPEGDRILLEGQWTIGDAVRPFRWTFSDITPDSFHWECRIRQDGGRWGLAEEMKARRVPREGGGRRLQPLGGQERSVGRQ